MSKKYDFDYIIVGSGPAGSTAALELVKTKKRIALIEGRFFGGSRLNRDIPYSVALDFSHFFHRLHSYPELKNQDIFYNLPTVPACELQAIVASGNNNSRIFEDAGITCIKGYANFLDSHTIAVKEKKYTSAQFILATGSRPKYSEISGTEQVNFLTPEQAIKIRRLPKVIAVVGAGSTGCEIAEYYAELGAKVILLESSDRILPREDVEVGHLIQNYFNHQLDISCLLSSKVVAIEQDNFSKSVIFRQDNNEKMVRVDAIVLATGSQPFLDYGLENARVKYKNTGITANRYFETSAKNIYAIGDCLGGESSTTRATQEGLNLANNLIKKTKNPINYQGFVRTINTYPEIATVGLNEDDLLKRDRKYQKSVIELSEINASKIYNFPYGFIKILVDRSARILGATIVAPHAELIAAELSLAIRHNLTIVELASTPHPIDNYNYLVKLAAKKLLTKK